ncbi:hypothetical protein C0991_003715, partial [Blastosporella zonata]
GVTGTASLENTCYRVTGEMAFTVYDSEQGIISARGSKIMVQHQNLRPINPKVSVDAPFP